MTNEKIAIIGGGFAGAVCAIHLMRLANPPSSIVIYEPREYLGLGLAYGVRDDNLRLNVPPTRMNIGVEEEHEFSAWLQQKNPELLDLNLLERTYLPRYVYGDFIQELLGRTIASYAGEFTHKREWVTKLPQGFNKIFLCLGNGQSKSFHEGESDLIVNDPWDVEAIRRLAKHKELAIIGTGLSACDAAAVLEDEGFTGKITFFSKQAKFPLADAPLGEKDAFDLSFNKSSSANQQALQLIKKMRSGIAQYDEWQVGFNDFKGEFLKLWPKLSSKVQERLDSKLRKFWFIHRYRMAPDLFAFMEHQLSAKRYRLAGKRVQSLQLIGEKSLVQLGDSSIDKFDGVINCSGPRRLLNSLVSKLTEVRGACVSKNKTGLTISSRCQLISAQGNCINSVFVIGGLAEPYYGDLVGASDIAEQIASVVNEIEEKLVV